MMNGFTTLHTGNNIQAWNEVSGISKRLYENQHCKLIY